MDILTNLRPNDPVDYRETKTFLIAILYTGVIAFEFGLIFVIGAGIQVEFPETAPLSPVVSLAIGIIPAAILGVGGPYVVQTQQYFKRLRTSKKYMLLAISTTLGMYSALFLYHPAASLLYGVVYIVGRIFTLSGIYIVSWIRSSFL